MKPGRIVAALAAAAVALLVVEAGLRVYASLTHQPRGMIADATLGWRMLPGVTKIGALSWGVTRPATTNSHGWRDREHAYAKPTGIRRAVAIGDSFTFGADVDDGDRFTDVLPDRINHLEVINVGVPGYGTDQELRVLETEGFRYQPDAVILTICVINDLDDLGYERVYGMPKPYYTLEGSGLHRWDPALTWDLRARNASYLVEAMHQRVFGLTKRRVPGFTAMEAARLFDALFERIVSLTRQHGATLVAVLAFARGPLHPDWQSVVATITASVGRAGVAVVDTRTLFASKSSDPATFFYAEPGGHWNARGHAAVADGLADALAHVGIK